MQHYSSPTKVSSNHHCTWIYCYSSYMWSCSAHTAEVKTSKMQHSPVVKAFVIHHLSLAKSIESTREQHTKTYMTKAWTNGRAALIKPQRLSSLQCGCTPTWAVVIRLNPSSEFSPDTTAAQRRRPEALQITNLAALLLMIYNKVLISSSGCFTEQL